MKFFQFLSNRRSLYVFCSIAIHFFKKSVVIGRHLVFESAPFASHWGVLVSLVKLDVLDGVAQAAFVDTSATCNIAADFNDRQCVDQFFGIGHVGHR